MTRFQMLDHAAAAAFSPPPTPSRMRSLIGSRDNCEMRLLPEREMEHATRCSAGVDAAAAAAAARIFPSLPPTRMDFSSDFISLRLRQKKGFHHTAVAPAWHWHPGSLNGFDWGFVSLESSKVQNDDRPVLYVVR